MKLAPLLSQYLYQQKQLHLAGIGSFTLDPNAVTDPKNMHDAISFEYNTRAKEDEQLVTYVSTHTGKQKALASSDLNSYIDTAKEFLNIGKPFQIEGIGTLVKKKGGELEFTADNMSSEKMKESGMKELSATSTTAESFTTYENLKPHVEKDGPYKKIFMALLVLVTTGIVIWGGYKLYRMTSNNSSKNDDQSQNEAIPAPEPVKKDTAASTVTRPVGDNRQPGTYRFVIETALRQRALNRYAQLKKTTAVQLSTTDSIHYKLYFVLHATPADTARMRDSLGVWYPALNKRKGFVE